MIKTIFNFAVFVWSNGSFYEEQPLNLADNWRTSRKNSKKIGLRTSLYLVSFTRFCTYFTSKFLRERRLFYYVPIFKWSYEEVNICSLYYFNNNILIIWSSQVGFKIQVFLKRQWIHVFTFNTLNFMRWLQWTLTTCMLRRYGRKRVLYYEIITSLKSLYSYSCIII